MVRIIKFDLLLRYMVLLTIFLSIIVYTLIQNVWFPGFSIFKVITISSIISSLIIFLLLSPKISRIIWGGIRLIDNSQFPDLNGSWEGNVSINIKDGEVKDIPIRAVIRQTLFTTQIDMHGKTTKSITLETTPTIEQGQKKLYYVYRSVPKNPSWPSYNGSTLFDVREVEADNKKNTLELSGHYYTDRKTVGRICIRQVSTDPSKDVSFY